MEPLDYNRITVSWRRTKNELERNRAVLINNRNSLKYFLGLAQHDSLVLSEMLAGDPVITASGGDPELYPSVKEKQLYAKSALWNIKREKYKRLPEISLVARYVGQAQRNELNFLDGNKPWYPIGVAGLRFEMPLFTGLARSSNIKKLRYRYEAQKKEVEKETERVKMEDNEWIANYYASAYMANNLSESYLQSQQNITIAGYKYAQGLYNLDQYLNILNESLTTQGQYIQALSDMYCAKNILELKKNMK
jgi:outer membrane protein TolC